MPWRFPQMWTMPQRMVLSVAILLLSLTLAIGLHRDSRTVPTQLPDQGPRADETATQLDLNTADATALSAIPHLGPAKARAIVAFRNQLIAEHPGAQPFESMEQLYRVKGIGPSSMEALRQYTFIGAAATSRP